MARPMTCERCGREATVHLSERSEGGDSRTVHYCEACAREAGVDVPATPPDLALDAVLQGLIVANVGELVGVLARKVCPTCGITFRDYRSGRRLGCPRDYEVFAAGLVGLIRQAHHATRHVGKVPRRLPGPAGDILDLRAKMRKAVAAEDYEEASRLRDRIRLLREAVT
jgi:protein arginine kinase activator